MSTAPSNLFQKFSLSGSLQATPSTRVTGAASYSHSSQNAAFLSDATAPIVPVASAQALVVNESVNLKISNRTTKDLTLSGGYKYDLRENRTPVNTYVFYDNGEAPAGVSPFRYLFPSLPTMTFSPDSCSPFTGVFARAPLGVRDLRGAWGGWQRFDTACLSLA